MNAKLIAAAVAAGVAYVVYVRIHANIIVKRFPSIDPKVVRKAHSIMVKRALAGAYVDTDDSDETNDRIFLGIIAELRAEGM